MSKGFVFWFLMLLWVLSVLYGYYRQPDALGWYTGAGSLLEFLLFALLGWHCFGKPIE